MSKIKRISVEEYDGDVYNIEVQNTHNYFAEEVLVSNCHEASTAEGKHGDIMHLPFFETLRPLTELAIGGGNPLAHPDIEPFLEKCALKLGLLPSMTVNQRHFMENIGLLKDFEQRKILYGLGVSLTDPSPDFVEAVGKFPNAVMHVIAGIVTEEQLMKLRYRGLKILFLGYKHFRRGDSYYGEFSDKIDKGISALRSLLPKMIEEGWFDDMSFDNLAIDQLGVKNVLGEEEYSEFFLGEDGFATMYVDCVNEEFARSSTSLIRYPITEDIGSMFEKVRSRSRMSIEGDA